MDTKSSILDELLSKMQKGWIPYEGPNGGEGWQSTEDPTDIRYTEEPPGQVASENTSDDELSPSEITDASEIKANDIKFDTEDIGHEIQYSFHAMDNEIQFDMGIPKDGDSAMAYHMWIDESQRGEGVATELMVAAEQEAKENGMKNLNATIGGDPEATQAFFESLGYEEGIVEDGELVQPEGEWAYYHKPLENESEDSEETSDGKESRTMSDEELDIHEYSVDGIEEAFRSASEEGSNADLIRAMELQDFRRSEISDNFWVGEVDRQSLVAEVYEYDGDLTFEKIEDFQRWMGDKFSGFRSESVTDYLDQTHEESHEEEFWRGDDAYHATGPETAAKIIVSGELQSRNKTRGMGNSGVGSAVFTSMNSGAWMDIYGAVQFEIDVQAMKEDGYQPTVEPEPEVAEAKNEEMFAQQMGVYGYYAQIPHDVSQDTAIIYGDIPKKYLSLNADDQTIDNVESHVNQLEETGGISTEEAKEAREWVQRQHGKNKSVSKSQSDSGRIYVDSETMDLGICRSDSFGGSYYKVSKSWIPYEGPQGGEGWQNSEDPTDVRYTSDPPGEVAEGYEEQAENWGDNGEEDGDTDIALEEGDPRLRIETPEDAVQALAEFDESDYEYNYWESDGEIAVGSIVEIPTDIFQMQGDGEKAIVGEFNEESGNYRVVTEDGVGYEFIPQSMGFDETGEGEASMLGVWNDPANQIANGEREWSDFSESAIPDEVREVLGEDETESEEESDESQGDADWFDSTDFNPYTSENGLFSGGKYAFRNEVVRLDEAGEARGVQYFDSEGVHNTFAEIDGIATVVSEHSSVDTGAIQNIHFSDDADLEDGWYRIGDDTRVEDDGESIFVEFEDQDGNITEIDAVEVEQKQLIDRKHTPAEINDATPSMVKPWENYEREYPENPELPDHLNTGNITEENGYTAESIKSINSGLGRVADIGLDRQISSIEVLDEEGTLGRFDPNTDQVLLNPKQMNQEQLDKLSEDFSVGETVEDLVVHEAMHAAHVEALLEDGWSVDEMFDELLNKPLNESEKQIMERDVSTYGASNALEVVAEVGLAITMGKEVSDEALFIYEKYGGPEL